MKAGEALTYYLAGNGEGRVSFYHEHTRVEHLPETQLTSLIIKRVISDLHVLQTSKLLAYATDI